ncbi:MAG: N-6 DNA methylase [Bacteroidales bacterium]|nr:N-6 DNA methylase [Bacteroidales bacterium]
MLDLYKVFSPEHLLTKNFVNDSNSLNREFYTELLHIIGLGETKEKSKKLIGRKAAGARDDGSILENTINVLRSRNRLYSIEKPEKYGDTEDERLFSAGLELVITWLNRILFLKLLEGQLIAYHQGDISFAFLNNSIIEDFDQLNELFFDVLAIPEHERLKSVSEKFGNLPYLNSSLFEESELERKTITIAELKDRLDLSVHPSTVLKDTNGRRITGRKNTLQYLFEFLDSFDFSSDSKAEIQEQNKSLISASVLGLIFEKINGYKDGSFFTPGFITMYMCRETIRRAVMQKFNDAKGWNCEEFGQLYNKIDDKKEANSLINSLKICDPAVGSGHFLVSALNEIIAIKSELKILLDRQGKTLRDYQVEVVNDELVISDDDGRFFRYNPRNEESRRVQEALFHEKQTIIENCLFGVDINPKSVMICRLRLWIELLKNAYYITCDSQPNHHLETLPNLDINIKCGNSLISRFPLDADLGEALRKSKWNMDSYRLAVMTYRNAETKEQKRAMEKLILDIKSDFETEVTRNDKHLLKLNKLKGELFNLTTQPTLFEKTKAQKAAWEKQVKKFTTEISTIESALEEVRSNRIYENAFEWRFEFPEVLDNDGKFVGFDIVIENPPYVFARENFDSSIKKYFVENFKTTQYQVNSFFLFIEKSISILRRNGEFALIVPNSLLMVSSAKSLREYILNETALSEIINLMGYTFEGVNVETIIFSGKKHKSEENSIKIFMNDGQEFILNQTKVQSLFWNNEGYELNVFSDKESDVIINKLKLNTETLNNLVKIKAGLKAYESGKGVPKQSPEDVINRIYDYTYKQDSGTFEYLEGKDVSRYFLKWSGTYLRYGDHLAAPRTFDIFNNRKIIIREITSKFPQCINATYSEDIYLFNMSNIAVLDKEISNISLKYILGLLNSKLMSYYFIKNTAKSVRQMFPKLIIEDLRKFPIKSISMSDQLSMITLVDQILAAKKSDPHADTSALENEIDQLVYGLYGLTEEEIRIVEGG